MPEWKQRNVLAESVELTQKLITGTETPDDLERITELEALWDQVKVIRSKSDTLETTVNGKLKKETLELITWV